MDQSLLFYESDRSADPCLQISVKDIVCLGVSRPDSSNNNNNNGFIDRFALFPVKLCVSMMTQMNTAVSLSVLRFRYTFELYLKSQKLYQFGLETADALHSWTRSIGKV